MKWGDRHLHKRPEIYSKQMSGIRISIAALLATGLALSILVQGGQEYSVSLAGAVIRLDQFILALALPLAILARRGRLYTIEYRSAAVRAYVVALLVIIFVTVGVKVGDSAAIRELKNVILVLSMAFVITMTVVRRPDRVELVFRAVMLGAAVSILFALIRTDLSAGVVRPIADSAFRETIGVSYIWLGLAGGMGFLCGLNVLRGAPPMKWKVTTYFACAVCLSGIVVGGSRSVVYVLATVPLFVSLFRRFNGLAVRGILIAALLAWIMIALHPGRLVDTIPQLVDIAGASGERQGNWGYLASAGYILIDLQARIADWDRMLFDRSITAVVFGGDWEAALQRSMVLRHPHNVVIWTQLLWGLVGTVLLGIAYIVVLYYSIALYRGTTGRERGIARTLLVGHLLLLAVLMTNSWIWGSQQLLGIWSAITVSSYFRFKRGRVCDLGVGAGGMARPHLATVQ